MGDLGLTLKYLIGFYFELDILIVVIFWARWHEALAFKYIKLIIKIIEHLNKRLRIIKIILRIVAYIKLLRSDSDRHNH